MRAGSLINVNRSNRASAFGHCTLFILKNSSFSVPYFFFSPSPSQYKFNQTQNPVNIKSIINIYNPHTLKIPSITKMWMISSEQPARPGVICMPHKASACQAPVLFSSPRTRLFSAQIKYRSFVLVEDRCFFFFFSIPPSTRANTHSTHRGGIDAQCWWRFIIEKEIVSIWLEFVMGGLCSRHLYCRASLSVGTVRSVSSLCLCVVEFSALCSVFQRCCPNN